MAEAAADDVYYLAAPCGSLAIREDLPVRPRGSCGGREGGKRGGEEERGGDEKRRGKPNMWPSDAQHPPCAAEPCPACLVFVRALGTLTSYTTVFRVAVRADSTPCPQHSHTPHTVCAMCGGC